jgi:hypothetical protein
MAAFYNPGSKSVGEVQHLAFPLAETQLSKHGKTSIDVPLPPNDIVDGFLGGFLILYFFHHGDTGLVWGGCPE